MSMRPVPMLAVALAFAARSLPLTLQAQGPTPDQLLTRAIATLRATETERGVELLRQLVAAPAASPGVRLEARLQLAAASWALGLYDSATAHFQAAIRQNPFVRADPEAFHPDLVTAFQAAKRATIAVGLQAARDTALEPKTERWPVTVAVTRPGRVWIRLQEGGARPESPDLLVATATVESTTTMTLALTGADSLALAPGSYRLLAEYVGPPPGGQTAQTTLPLELARQSADTQPHEPAPARGLFRPETRLGPPSRPSLVRGLGFGVAAGTIPLLIGSSRLRDKELEPRALAVGAVVSIAGLAGFFLARPKYTLHENVAFNRTLRAAWEGRNRAIATANEARRRVVLLRVRLAPQP